jgi:hypothetical protein
MKVNSIEIKIDEFDHAAMVDDPTGEVVRLLRELADRIAEYGVPNADGSRLVDTNGRPVGEVRVDWEEDEEEWDEDLSSIRTIQGRYGSGKTPCNLFVCDEYLWYCVEGSQNMNKAPYGTEFEDGIWIEPIEDVDTMTVEPVQSEEEFARHIWERESE